jgi:hypothetical protein
VGKIKYQIFIKLFVLILIFTALTKIIIFPFLEKSSVGNKKVSYSGSKNCMECHQSEFAQWKSSHHALAERMITPEDHISAKFNKYRPERVIGEDPIRQFLVKFPGGRYQASELTYDPKKNEWFNVFGNENRRQGEWGHWTGRGMNWNSQCASCHNTNVSKNYDEKTDSYKTTMAEMAISCESCHGPLNEHGKKGYDAPTKLSKDQILENCASCHSRRQDLTGEFKPGDSFHDHFNLTIVDGSDIFYGDGQIKGENYEYSSFLGSKMYERGVRCIDCHNPHTAKLKLPGNLMCLSCHNGSDPTIPAINPTVHTNHQIDPLYSQNDQGLLEGRDKRKVAKMGGECINCHMPQTVYMQRHWRHDHGFTIPDPSLTKKFKIPNACNRCHTDKNPDWAIKWTKKWYGNKMDRPSQSRARIITQVKSGDYSNILKLIEMTQNSNYWRAVAINLLGPFSQESNDIKNLLITSLDDKNPLVREKASQFFDGNIPKKALNDSARSVRFNAQWAIRSSIDLASPEGAELWKILNFRSDQPTGRIQKGAFFLSRGENSDAISYYEKALEWDLYSAPIHHDLAIILAGQNRLEEAASHLKKASELEPWDVEHKYKLGLALNELGKKSEAIKSLRAALKLDPKNLKIQEAIKAMLLK